MRLKEYAEKMSISYRTAQEWFYKGYIDGAYKTPSGSVMVKDETSNLTKDDYVVIYCRVSSSQNKPNLETQAERLISFALAKGYKISEVIKEVGSGVNDKRSKLNKLLKSSKPTKIIVEHKDRLTRFGFNYIEILLERLSCSIEVVNEVQDDKEDIIQDFTSIITSFCARIYGQRRNKRRTEKLIKELNNTDD